MHRLLIYFGLIFICAIFSASSEVGAGLVVTKEEVHKTVRDYVLGAISDFGGDVQVSVRWRGKLELTGKGEVKLQVRPSGARSSARQMQVVLEIYTEGKMVKEYFILADIRYFDHVFVSSRPISRGEAITDLVVSRERREVTAMLGRYVSDFSELEGMQAKVRIGFGRAIGRRYLERIPAVERGDMVRIRADVGGVNASITGVASASGAVGEKILVRNLSSRQKLLAVVVAPGVVRVVF